jgi:hypothetical protein
VKVIECGPIKDTISVPMNPVTAENIDKYLKK